MLRVFVTPRVPSPRSRIASQHGRVHIKTLIALAVVATMTAIILPRFVELRAQANDGATKANMRLVNNAAEEYARQHGGEYPAEAAELVPYLPGHVRLVNAFTGRATEPSTGLPAAEAPAGSVWYIPAHDARGVVRGFAVRGVGRGGRFSLEFASIQ